MKQFRTGKERMKACCGQRMGAPGELAVDGTLAAEPVRKVHCCSITVAAEAPKRKAKNG